jgi:hypothetical protein
MSQHRVDEAELLRTYLAERNAPCPQCGFSLRGLESPRCPECGHELRLTVGSARFPRGTRFAAALVLAAGVGAAGSVVLATIVQSVGEVIRSGRLQMGVDYDSIHAFVSLGALPIFVMALGGWLRVEGGRRRISRLSQMGALGWACVLVAGYVLLMGLLG